MNGLMDEEAPTLKLARYQIWSQVAQANGFMTSEILLRVPFEEIPGYLSHLMTFGMRRKLITLVEEDPDNAMLLYENCDGMKVIRGDVVRIGKSNRRAFCAAILVYNEPLTRQILDEVSEFLVHGMKEGGVVALQFAGVGDDVQSEIEESRSSCLALAEDLKNGADLKRMVRLLSDLPSMNILPNVHSDAFDDLQYLKEADVSNLEVVESTIRLIVDDMKDFAASDATSLAFNVIAGRLMRDLSRRLVMVTPLRYYRYKTIESPVGIFVGSVSRAGVGKTQQHLIDRLRIGSVVRPTETYIDCSEEGLIESIHRLMHSMSMDTRTRQRVHDPTFIRRIPAYFNITEEKWKQWKSRMQCQEHGGAP